jgi:hypothetical protein
MAEEARLTSTYLEKLATDTVDVKGEQLTYSDIFDIDDYILMSQALEKWYETYNGEYAGIYIDL